MKKFVTTSLLTFCLLAIISFTAMAQNDKANRASPPATATASMGDLKMNYSQPAVKGRDIFGGLIPYDKVWRTGANEATTFEVNKDVMVEGKALPAGKYGLYTIPGENEWTIIFNKVSDQWGTNYDESKDALRVKVKPEKADKMHERFTIETSNKGEVSLLWDETKVDFQVKGK